MPGDAKVPPARLVRLVEGVRARVGSLHRKMVPPQVAMIDLISGSMVTQALYAAAKLGIADVLKDGPLRAKDIADRVHAHPDAVNRLMRALASQGVFRVDGQGRYSLTALGRTLRSDAEVPMGSMAMMVGSPEHWEHWGHLLDSVRDGGDAVSKVRGMDVWAYFEQNRSYAEVFNTAMTSMSAFAKAPVLAAYDFSGFRKIVDGRDPAAVAGLRPSRRVATPTS
ncbi:O-methyltransferase [Actinokineospora alba]|uniref:O-methyltransferase n=1 Tax=Actinokineospora alba TaxID=504798 RepID=A0A1H0Q587_9PSEU|nr:acetylserotonin O-methyltransferase [Actinokineospora alba]TDP66054.1 O-methyltransferase [Actinokineospora alba]SDI59014.1 O-methyltransferase [Actinokineospora alba]SDP11828.1 O-methyltransferase [Actinokineospora alba]